MKIALLLCLVPLATAGFSANAEVSPKNDISCALCMTVMEVLDATITDPTNEQEVAVFLDQICSFLPDLLQQECHTMILEYTDDIIELLVNQYLAPRDVCDALTLCP